MDPNGAAVGHQENVSVKTLIIDVRVIDLQGNSRRNFLGVMHARFEIQPPAINLCTYHSKIMRVTLYLLIKA